MGPSFPVTKLTYLIIADGSTTFLESGNIIQILSLTTSFGNNLCVIASITHLSGTLSYLLTLFIFLISRSLALTLTLLKLVLMKNQQIHTFIFPRTLHILRVNLSHSWLRFCPALWHHKIAVTQRVVIFITSPTIFSGERKNPLFSSSLR